MKTKNIFFLSFILVLILSCTSMQAQAPVATAATNVSDNYFTANWNAVANAVNYRLDVSTDNFATYVMQNGTVNGTSYLVSCTANAQYRYRVRAVVSGVTSANSNVIAVSTPPKIPTANATSLSTNSSFTASWSSVTGATGYRLDVSTDPNFTSFVAGYNNLSLTTTTRIVNGLAGGHIYYYRVRASNGASTSASSAVIVVSGLDQNYIRTQTIKTPSITTATGVAGLDVISKSTAYVFYDGLGRPTQQVTMQGSPLMKDVVQPIGYDGYGREAKKYLPYVSQNENNGWYKLDALSDPVIATYQSGKQYSFYQGTGGVAVDQYPYATTIFEPSPLNRVIKQGAAGQAWQPDGVSTFNSTDHTIKNAYEFNDASEVLNFEYVSPDADMPSGSVALGNPAYYKSSSLVKSRVKDEQGNEVIQFTDKEGRIILKKVQLDATTYAQTYYIYTKAGDLGIVLPPEATKMIESKFVITWLSKSSMVTEGPAPYFNSLVKSGTSGYGNAGAYFGSIEAAKDGWVEMIAAETNTSRMIGLSETSVNIPDSGIKYALEFADDGKIYRWESGLKDGDAYGSYTQGTVIRVSREAGTVKYYVDGKIWKTSSVSSNAVAYCDVALNHNGATIKGVTVSFSVSNILATTANAYAFIYAYDKWRRIVQKKIPGASPIYLVYDKKDRLILSQDGNQRAGGIKFWNFTKYDELNRPVATGIKDTTAALTQTEMQSVVDFYQSKSWTLPDEKYIGNAGGNVHGYSNQAYPSVSNEQYYLTVNYYDNYNFKSNWTGAYDYVDEKQKQVANNIEYNQPITASTLTVGLPTGTKVKVLDGNISATISGGYTWLKTINYYDDKYRVVQTISDNFKGGIDRTTQLYDFTGKILKSKELHIKRSVTWKNLVGAKAEGNKLTRFIAGNSWGLSGASSAEVLAANTDGWMEFVVSETNTNRMIGLATADPDQNYTSINHCLYINSTSSSLKIYESGNILNSNGSCKTGDVIRIERVGSKITYNKNNVKIMDSPVASTAALIVDAALNTNGSTFTNVSSSFSTLMDSTIRTFEYDHAGRLTKVWHRYNNGTNYLLTKNEYNELGQLVDKKLHSTDVNATTAKQSVDMRYNIRGWLTSINNATLANDGVTNDELGDFFGMDMAYDQANTSLGSTAMYNGNISAIRWSKDLGLNPNVKEQAYVYSYDAMSRLQSATHKLSPTPNTWSSGKFNEDGLTYDLNGNIKTLNRTNEGAEIDKLVYSYGTGATLSNQLLRVTDQTSVVANRAKGFVDYPTTGDDYSYDANGNMTRDLNKGIGTGLTDNLNIITYNFLNLPETVRKGESRMNYFYDATGRKLSQLVSSRNDLVIRQTDYVGAHVYENNVLQFVNHEEGRLVVGKETMIYFNHADATTDFVTVNSPTTSIVNQNDNQNYLKVTSTGTTAGTGISSIGAGIIVDGGARYKIRVKGYHEKGTSSISKPNAARLAIKLNGNELAPGPFLPYRANTPVESWIEQTVTIPAGGQQLLEVGVLWPAVTVGENFLINEVEVIKLEAQAPEYQYFLKDHLGNVRVTFTANPQTLTYTAGFETANQSTEAANFSNYPSGGQINTQSINARTGTNSQLLNGGYNGQVGVAKSFAVMPGDQVQIQAYAKYSTPSTTSTNYNNFVMSLLSAFNLSAPVAGEVGTPSSGVSAFGNWEIGSSGNVNEDDPIKVFVTIILFDKNYNFVDVAYAASTSSGALISKSYTVKQPGYAYLYVSNEHPKLVDVYIDDVTITHIPSAVVQMEDYYPFGLTFNSCERENTVTNSITFQNQELQDELNLGWVQFKWRNAMPEIGRFFNVDPLSEDYYYNSVYAFSENKVVAHVELEGLESSYGPLNQAIEPTRKVLMSAVDDVKQFFEDVKQTFTKPKDPDFKKVDENQGDQVGKGETMDFGDSNEAPFNPDAKPHVKENDSKTVNTTEGGQEGATTDRKDNTGLTVKEVYSTGTDTVWSKGGLKRVDNVSKDSTFMVREGTVGGKPVEKIVEKKKGTWSWTSKGSN